MAEAWDCGNYDEAGTWETPEFHAIDGWGTVDDDQSQNGWGEVDTSGKTNSTTDWGINLNETKTREVKANYTKVKQVKDNYSDISCDDNLNAAFEKHNYKSRIERGDAFGRRSSQRFPRNGRGNSRGKNQDHYQSSSEGNSRTDRSGYRSTAEGENILRENQQGYSRRGGRNNYQNYNSKSDREGTQSDSRGKNNRYFEKNQRGFSKRGGRSNYESEDSNETEIDHWGRIKKRNDASNNGGFKRGNRICNSGGQRGRNHGDKYKSHGSSSDAGYNSDFNKRKNDKNYKFQNGGNSSGVPSKMSPRRLKDILEQDKDPDKIMLSLKAEKSGFPELLNESSLTSEMVTDILELLDGACQSTKKLNLLQLLGTVIDSNFLVRHIPDYLVDLRLEAYQNNQKLVSGLKYLTSFLMALPEYQPASSYKILTIILPQLSSCFNALVDVDTEELDYTLLDSIEELEGILVRLTNDYQKRDIKKLADTEKQHAAKPPDSFYSLSIFPTQEELNSVDKPFLRCNIAEGRYVNVEHYLDTQFRLMREDFVRPLREGIGEYQNRIVNENKRQKIQGLYIYNEVRVLDARCGLDGIHHVAQFDTTYLGHVDWSSSKRFFPGSLVCLSSDNFQTILFATVARRDPVLLLEGTVFIHFEEKNDKVKKILPNETFVMIESSAFFEAYYHNLVCMKRLKEDNFPLKDYIVYVQRDIQPPKYLNKPGRKYYDIRPLLCPYPEKRPPSKDFFNEDKVSDNKDLYNFTPLMDYLEDIPVLDAKAWPPHYELGLDEFQLKALQLALTKEFVMIQGPPGTGKTFIGLRIVQLLLFNSQFWMDEDQAPILIVCFTNHALDQFLEGVLHFTRSMIRVGGRCESEELQSYRINAKRMELKDSGKLPWHIRQNKRDISQRLQRINAKIDSADKNVSRALQDILNDEDLEKCMGERHFASLKRDNPSRSSSGNDGKLLLDWLQLRFRVDEEDDATAADVSSSEDEVSSSIHSYSHVLKPKEDAKNEENRDESKDVDDFFEDPAGFNEDQAYLEEINEEILKIQRGKDGGREDDAPDEDSDPKSKILRKKRRNTLQTKLRNKSKKKMEQAEVDGVSNIWNTNIEQRWKLYFYWVDKFIMQNYQDIYEYQDKYEENINLLKELRIEEDHYIIKGCKILGMTTTGAAKNQRLLADLKPKIVIVEEAAEVSEAHIITALNENTQQVILIGDHQQLRPSQASYSLAQEHDIDISLFERMVKNKVYFQQLVSQHRMRPCISNLLVPDIYKVLKDSPSVSQYEAVKGVASNMYFVTHRYTETQEKDSVSRINQHEAKFITKLAKYFVDQGYKKTQITILATYSAQVFVIKQLMEKEALHKVAVKSVDNYQGEENDIVLISFVRSNAKEMVGFLKIHNRVCVALSRARKGLFAVGNFDMLAAQSDLWKNLVAKLDRTKAIGSDLKLICQIHPNTFVDVRDPEDFDKVPEGGCSRSCDYRLKCGHSCPRRCHPYDPKHERIQCKEPCDKKTCKLKHRCPKKCFQCDEGCGECVVLVTKELPCGHEYKLPCFKDPTKEVCRMNCGRLLDCSHVCVRKCGEPCEKRCNLTISKTSPCGHNVKIPCSQSKDRFELLRQCVSRCDAELGCGHNCKGKCGTCKQGTLHQPCSEPCTRYLVCGHKCQEPCSKACQPCKRKCENKCAHNKCPKLCGQPCELCAMRCGWHCAHKRCKNLCGESCDKCNQPCKKLLKSCQHQCIGFCGEKCPSLCLICDKDRVTDIFFGMEDVEGVRYVELEDCRCVFESVGLEKWAKAQCEVDNVIRKLKCPKCQKVINNSHYLEKYVKKTAQQLEKVKEKLYGMRRDIVKRHKHLLSRVTRLYQQLQNQVSDYRFKEILNAVKTVLDEDSLDIGCLTAMENYLNFVERMNSMDEDVWKVNDDIVVSAKVYDVTVKNHLKHLQNNVAAFMVESCKNRHPSQQQIQDLNRELNRIGLVAKIISSVHIAGGLERLKQNELANKNFKTSLAHALTPNALPKATWDKIVILLTDMRRSLGLALISVTERERKSIIAAVGLSQGHWYQCPNGHVYCIGECGGATQLSRCNECGAKIGGENHALQSGNRVATEMDGATVSAWSEVSNIQNFRINDD